MSYTPPPGSGATVNIVVGLVKQNNASQTWISLTTGLNEIGPALPIVNGGNPGDEYSASSEVWIIGAARNGPVLEQFSSTGASHVFWNYSVTSDMYTAINPPLEIQHPDFTGIDGWDIAYIPGFDVGSQPYFYGTSAAAPAVAGVVAMMLEAGFTKTEIYKALAATSKPVNYAGVTVTQTQGTWGPLDGYGVPQVWDALKQAGFQVPEPAISTPSGFSASVTAGGSVTFAGSCTLPAGQTNPTYSWDFGDGQTSTEQNPGAVTFASAGTDTVTFNCATSSGFQNPEPATFTVNVSAPTGSSGGGSGGSSGGKSGGGGGGWAVLAMALLGLGLRLYRRKAIG